MKGKEKDKQTKEKVISGVRHSNTLQTSPALGRQRREGAGAQKFKTDPGKAMRPYLKASKQTNTLHLLQWAKSSSRHFSKDYSQVTNSKETVFGSICQQENANQSHRVPLQTGQQLKLKLETDGESTQAQRSQTPPPTPMLLLELWSGPDADSVTGPQILKFRVTIWLRSLPKRTGNIFIQKLPIIAQKWDHPRGLSTAEEISRTTCTYDGIGSHHGKELNPDTWYSWDLGSIMR